MNIELFKDAIAVIDGIPTRRIDLDSWRNYWMDDWKDDERQAAITCGTICCAGGWFAIYPPFQALGLSADEFGCPQFGDNYGMDALAQFFGIAHAEAYPLFSSADYESGKRRLHDKTVWLRRARALLKKYEAQQ